MRRIQCVSTACVNRFGLYHIALMQRTVEDADLELHRVVGREGVLNHQCIVNRAADGLWLLRVADAFETRVEAHCVVALRLRIPVQQRCLYELTIDTFHVVDHHIIIMCIVETERRKGVGIIEAQVAVAVSVQKRDDALATESAVGIHQISEAFVGNLRLNGVFHGLLAGRYYHSQK